MKPGLSLLLIAGLLGAAEASTILVQDHFNDLGTANLDDREPSTNETGIAGLAWSASTTVATASVMKGNGEGGISFTTSTQTAGFHLGEGYFTANPGIYQLSMDITYPASLPATPNSWIGLGFSQGLNTEQNLTHGSNNGGPWLFYRGSGTVEGRALPATARSVATGLSSGVTRNFAIELDTTAAQWTFKVLIDGVQQGATYTYAEGENPNLSYITVSSGFSGNSFVGTFDNFSFTLVPEPSGMVLAAFSAGAFFLRRRR